MRAFNSKKLSFEILADELKCSAASRNLMCDTGFVSEQVDWALLPDQVAM